MDKKALSKPMTEILGRLPDDIFKVQIFGDECILHEPVENWPVVECLIAFYSSGYVHSIDFKLAANIKYRYPLDKALEYVELRKPFLINDLEMQRSLQDRRLVYEILQAWDIPVPRHVVVNRDGGVDNNVLEEFDDHIVINGVTFKKPFVEKPVDADDHNVSRNCLPVAAVPHRHPNMTPPGYNASINHHKKHVIDIHLLPHECWRW